MRDSARMVGFGLFVSALSYLPASRLIESQFYGVSATDPFSLAALLVTHVVACGAAAMLAANRIEGQALIALLSRDE